MDTQAAAEYHGAKASAPLANGGIFRGAKPKEDDADTSALPSDFLVGYAPGQPPEILAPGQAK